MRVVNLVLGLCGALRRCGFTARGRTGWAGGRRAGLETDRPGERMDMMLKPVEGVLSGMRAIAGTSLLGDGQVLIVLDLGALLE